MGSWRLSQKSTIITEEHIVPTTSSGDAMGVGDRTTTRDHWVIG